MSRFSPRQTASGAVLQGGIPYGPPASTAANGLLVRGVVVATYVYDDPQHPFANSQPAAIYCDVLVYTQLTGGRTYMVKSALVTQEFASLQAGIIYKPRAATQTISGAPLDPTQVIDPTQLDGDHVLVGFIDDRRFQPVILRAIPPPNADAGHAGDEIGRRTRLVLADGSPHMIKSTGVFYGISADGSWLIDASQGNQGGIDGQGHEIPTQGGGGITHRAKLAAGVKTELVDPASGQAAVTQTLGAGGFTVDYGTSPAAITVKGSQGNAVAIPGPGIAAVQLGAGGATLVSTTFLVTYLTALIPWIQASFLPNPGPKTPPPPATPATLGNPQVLVPGL